MAIQFACLLGWQWDGGGVTVAYPEVASPRKRPGRSNQQPNVEPDMAGPSIHRDPSLHHARPKLQHPGRVGVVGAPFEQMGVPNVDGNVDGHNSGHPRVARKSLI